MIIKLGNSIYNFIYFLLTIESVHNGIAGTSRNLIEGLEKSTSIA